MRAKRLMSLLVAASMAFGLTACGGKDEVQTTQEVVEEKEISYPALKVGTDYTDLEANIKILTNRTDMFDDAYNGKKYQEYIDDFNKIYPNIKIETEPITDYVESSTMRLSSGDWGDIMFIPDVNKSDLKDYFAPLGDATAMAAQVKWADNWSYEDQCYGVACAGDALGMVYNKKVFANAGIKETPKTPEEFIKALKAIKAKTQAIPLYTNYAAGWTMDGQWSPHIFGTATGDPLYANQKLAHTANPFSDPGDGTHAYNVYKILYDAVAQGLTEDDFTTTDWEGSKGMLNNGEIGCMVLGGWAYSQIRAAGEHTEDVAYMPFPITVGDKQYATAAPNYGYGVNVNSSDTNKIASILFIKWMTESSGYAYNEGGIPVKLDDLNYPEVYTAFSSVTLVNSSPARPGEEELLAHVNEESGLYVSAGGDTKVQLIVEHASNGDMEFDDIMEEWNKAWTDAQKTLGVEIEE